MKAAQISDYGHVDVVKVVDIDKPVAKAGQVLVEVHASSMNPFDTIVREGYMKAMIPLNFPATLGGDIAGVVAEVGSGVTGFVVGDEVFGGANVVAGATGAFAEFAATASSQLAPKPKSVDFVEAAASVLVGLSAYQAIYDHINLTAGQKILIHGGSGGIGSVAVQLAKHIGAHVATTATGRGLDYVKDLGADQIIDYKTAKFEETLKDYDAVFDMVGGEVCTKSFTVLKNGGVLVSMAGQPDVALAEKYNVTAVALMTSTTNEGLSKLAELIDNGVVKVNVDKIFDLSHIDEAFTTREAGGVLGKVGVRIKA